MWMVMHQIFDYEKAIKYIDKCFISKETTGGSMLVKVVSVDDTCILCDLFSIYKHPNGEIDINYSPNEIVNPFDTEWKLMEQYEEVSEDYYNFCMDLINMIYDKIGKSEINDKDKK